MVMSYNPGVGFLLNNWKHTLHRERSVIPAQSHHPGYIFAFPHWQQKINPVDFKEIWIWIVTQNDKKAISYPAPTASSFNPLPAVWDTQVPSPSARTKVSREKSNSDPKRCAAAALAQLCTKLPWRKRPAAYIHVQLDSKPSGLSLWRWLSHSISSTTEDRSVGGGQH